MIKKVQDWFNSSFHVITSRTSCSFGFVWLKKKKKGLLMGLCDRYKCGTFCEDYFKLRDQVTDALREPACRFAASRTKTILLSWYSDSQNARPHSPFSAPRWWLLNSSNGAVWSKVFYTRAPWQQVLREEGKKKSGGEYISHMGSCLSNSGFSFKTKTPELEALTGRRLAKKKRIARSVELNVLRRTEINLQYFRPGMPHRALDHRVR